MASPQARIALLIITGLLIAIAVADNYQTIIAFLWKDYSVAIAVAALALTGYQIWQSTRSNLDNNLNEIELKSKREVEDLEKRQSKYLQGLEQRIAQQICTLETRVEYNESLLQELIFKTRLHESLPGHEKSMNQIERLGDRISEISAISSVLMRFYQGDSSGGNSSGT